MSGRYDDRNSSVLVSVAAIAGVVSTAGSRARPVHAPRDQVMRATPASELRKARLCVLLCARGFMAAQTSDANRPVGRRVDIISAWEVASAYGPCEWHIRRVLRRQPHKDAPPESRRID